MAKKHTVIAQKLVVRIIAKIILDGTNSQGGASRLTGGRDERPPQSSSPSATPANSTKWVPTSALKRNPYNQDERNDAIFRKVRGILNKLAPEKFDKLGLELLNVGIESQTLLKGIILLIFEKALEEPKYSSLYAQLCHRLCEDAPNFEPPNSKTSTFKRLLLNKCQDEFENRARATAALEKDGPLSAEEEEQYVVAKSKMLGNIKFIGELGKLDMLHEGILHQCIKQLLGKSKRVAVADMAEDLECLCHMMKTVGRRLDHDKAKSWVDQYFERMKAVQNQSGLPSRIKFMLQDVLELRANNWVPRRILRENGPKTIQQVHHDAAREMGVYIPPSSSPTSMSFSPGGGGDLFGRQVNGFSGPSRGPMSDMFGPLPPSPPVMGGIGTGPGVIPMDPFGPSFLDGPGPNRGGRNRNFPHQFGNRRGGGGGPGLEKYATRESKPSYAKSDRERHHDDDDDDDRPGSGGSGGGGYSGPDSRGRGGPGPFHGNRGYNNSRGGRDGPGYQPRGGFNNYRGHQYNRNPNFQPRGGFSQDGPNRDYPDRNFPPPERNFDGDQPVFIRGGYNRDAFGRDGGGGGGGGFQPDGYARGGYRGGRGGFEPRGGFNPQRGGYGGFEHGRGGLDHGPNFNQQQNLQKDIDKLPPRFRKQLEREKNQTTQNDSPPMASGLDGPQPHPENRGPSPHLSGPAGTGTGPVLSGAPPVERGPPPERQSFFGPPQMAPAVRTPSPPVSGSPPPASMGPPPPPSYQTRSPSKHEEISLRPVRMPAFRPNIPSMLPKSAQGPPTAQMYRPVNAAPQPTFEDMIPPAQKASIMGGGPQPTNLTIRTVSSQEKAREQRKAPSQAPSQDELKQSTDAMLNEFLENSDVEKALHSLRALKAPKRYMPQLVTYWILRSLDKSDRDREAVSRLICATKEAGLIDSSTFMEGFEAVLDQMKSLESDVPLVKSYVSKLAAHACAADVMTLCELARPLGQGRHYPLFLLCLQQLHKVKDKDWLVKLVNESKVDLQSMLPECDQSKERMLEILDDRGLGFMFPLLRLQADLLRQLGAGGAAAGAGGLYKWLRDSYSAAVLADPGFVRILFTTVLGSVIGESTLADGEADGEQEPKKGLAKKEKELMAKYKNVLAGFIHDSIDLQVGAIYAVQVLCHDHRFPKGMLLRMFMNLYDLEIIEEDAFLRWKEDLNEEFPGKGKALFQVNQWLIWLEQAECESSDED